MPMSLGVPAETAPGERRVALTPDTAARLVKEGYAVCVEHGAGDAAFHPDEAYREAGARVVPRAEALACDVLALVQPLPDADLAALKPGAVVVGLLAPLDEPAQIARLAGRGVTALAMELVPRISRAQKLDALSAMSSIAGYKAVLMAADALPRYFPLLTTAAGTVKPAQVLVLGAGVAGLQAIATARRLGARVSAYDIRAAVKEEIESLGATFIELDLRAQDDAAAGGYAKALAQDEQQRQIDALATHIGKMDVVISTALIPGRKAPLLISERAVEAMPAGSVIVDLAAPNGGNCALTRPGETTLAHGVTILAPLNVPALVPVHASQLYARTVSNLLLEFTKDGQLTLDFDDDILKGACVARDGAVVNERVRSLLEMGD